MTAPHLLSKEVRVRVLHTHRNNNTEDDFPVKTLCKEAARMQGILHFWHLPLWNYLNCIAGTPIKRSTLKKSVWIWAFYVHTSFYLYIYIYIHIRIYIHTESLHYTAKIGMIVNYLYFTKKFFIVIVQSFTDTLKYLYFTAQPIWLRFVKATKCFLDEYKCSIFSFASPACVTQVCQRNKMFCGWIWMFNFFILHFFGRLSK